MTKYGGRLANKRVAAYQRYSSANQREASLEDQLYRAREFVAREGGDASAIRVVNDAAVSGSTANRPGLRELLALAENREIDAIVVEDVSRLARDMEVFAHSTRAFARNGVVLYGISDGIDTSARSSRVTAGLHALMAEEYLVMLSHETLRGQEGRARKGFSTGGRLYGFGSEPVSDEHGEFIGAKLTVRDEEALVVKRIFQSYVDGMSLSAIANALNADKITSPRANPKKRDANPKYCRRGWCASTIREMLHNESYIGKRTFKKRQWSRSNGLDAGGRGRTSRRRDPSEIIHFQGPRIVPDELWEAAAARLASVRAHYTKGRGEKPGGPVARPGRATTHLLSGVLRCQCGAPMVIAGGSSARYYRCADNMKRGEHICRNRLSVREDVSRAAILGELRHRLLSPRGIDFLRECIARELAAHARTARGQRAEVEGRLARTQARIARLVEFIADGRSSDAVATTLRDLEAQERVEKAAVRELEAVEAQPIRLPTPDEVFAVAKDLEQTLLTNPTKGREMLLELFDDDRIMLEPQPEGHYVARGRWFPLVVTLSAKTKTPRSRGPGRFVNRATALGCAGRI